MQNTIRPVEMFIRAGFKRAFAKQFGVVPKFSKSSNPKRESAKDGQPSKYPYAFIYIDSYALKEDGYKATTLARRGISSGASADNLVTYNVKLIPTDFGCQLKFYVQTEEEAQDFAKKWLFLVATGGLKFRVTYGSLELSIHVAPDNRVDIPQRPDNETSAVNEFEILVNCIVSGYMSRDEQEQQQAAIEVDTTAFIAAQDKALADLAARGGATKVFEYKSKWK